MVGVVAEEVVIQEAGDAEEEVGIKAVGLEDAVGIGTLETQGRGKVLDRHPAGTEFALDDCSYEDAVRHDACNTGISMKTAPQGLALYLDINEKKREGHLLTKNEASPNALTQMNRLKHPTPVAICSKARGATQGSRSRKYNHTTRRESILTFVHPMCR